MVEDSDYSIRSVEPIGASVGNPSGTNGPAPVAAVPSARNAPKRPPSAVPQPKDVAAGVSSQSLQSAVDQVNAHLATVNRVLQFRVDAETGLTIATISNAQTGEVLQQIPGTDIVHLAQMLAAWSPGRNVLVDLIA